MNLHPAIRNKIEKAANSVIKDISSIGGGCISDAYRLKFNSGEQYFLKLNPGSSSDMFIKEANGLNELGKANAIRVPKVLLAENDLIIIEFIEQGRKKSNFYEDFGNKFAMLHKYTAVSFGFYEDNYIGSTPQLNFPSEKESKDWTEFYFNKRLLYQFILAQENGYADRELRTAFSGIESKIGSILEGSEEKPCLLHGDLWGGNYLSDSNGNPCLIDPAVYYGNREADLAMTKLFGGFSSEFYNSYNETYPLPHGYDYRENIYKLYHILNHLNLFGRGYYSQAVGLMKFYL